MLFLLFFSSLSLAGDKETVLNYIKSQKWVNCRNSATNIIDKIGIFNADPTLFFMRGKCLYELNILTDALSDLNHAISSDNFDQQFLKEAYAIRGRLYLRMGMIFYAEVEAQKKSNLTLINDIKEAKEN